MNGESCRISIVKSKSSIDPCVENINSDVCSDRTFKSTGELSTELILNPVSDTELESIANEINTNLKIVKRKEIIVLISIIVLLIVLFIMFKYNI